MRGFDKTDPREVALRGKTDGKRYRSRFCHDNEVSYKAIDVEIERMLETYHFEHPYIADLYAKRFVFWALMMPGSEITPPKSSR